VESRRPSCVAMSARKSATCLLLQGVTGRVFERGSYGYAPLQCYRSLNVQDLAKEEAALADCERRLAALPYNAEAAAGLEATVSTEQAAVQGASDRAGALSSKLAGEPEQHLRSSPVCEAQLRCAEAVLGGGTKA